MRVELLSSAGLPSIITCGFPGDHDPVRTGLQGCGMPSADATAGLLGLVHMIKLETLAGVLHMAVAAGLPPAITVLPETLSEHGPVPKLHISIAPLTTIFPMKAPLHYS